MRPEAKHRIAHIIVMRHLNVVEQNDIFEFGGVSHHCVFADNRVPSDKGTVADLRVFVDNARAVDAGARRDCGTLCNPDAFRRGVKPIGRQRFPQLQNKIMNLRKNLPRISIPIEKRVRNRVRKIEQRADFKRFHYYDPSFLPNHRIFCGIGLSSFRLCIFQAAQTQIFSVRSRCFSVFLLSAIGRMGNFSFQNQQYAGLKGK